jgi:hypothetical protein
MSDMTTVIKEHPLAAGGILLGVALLAYFQSKSSGGGGSQSESYQYRGEIAAGIDPNAAAIEQAAIQAGTANLGTIASLTSSLAQTGAARDVQLSQTEANKILGLSGIDASLRSNLAATEAGKEESLAQTSASLSVEQARQAEQMWAATITQDLERQRIAAASYADKLHEDNVNFAIQADKDKKRAEVNGGIVNGLTGLAGNALAFFGL